MSIARRNAAELRPAPGTTKSSGAGTSAWSQDRPALPADGAGNHPRRVTLRLILQPTARGVAVATAFGALAGIENLIQPLFSIVAISLGVLCGTALYRGLRFGNTRLRK